ncbi:dipeptidyl-peptidase 3 [Gaeumannomyces tritici R3-111a-1]|uniref:Dipeptidyl peptidase 3 n=1 Tax=Gaeumannomyces tritici (strain R3-111a-1) TaxID=644352 RepID=J3P9V6_GAET3|nr:dipeptidyl-peptidase 3 [Gaeumannomyces tritici R3-111a-1]EJT73442.1 dipeptidyl-peptidase 3 [Gaeumannomyces tritici R3-111a-1]
MYSRLQHRTVLCQTRQALLKCRHLVQHSAHAANGNILGVAARPSRLRTRPIPACVRSFATSTMALSAQELRGYLADSPPSVVRLEIAKHFDALSDKQKRYAHYISRASLAGNRIVLRQVSPEAESIYDLIISLHKAAAGDWKALGKKAGVSDEAVTHFLAYAAQFLGNAGNYKSFGDSKFLPRCQESDAAALAASDPDANRHYKATNGAIFSADKPGLLHLGFPDDGHLTAYYPDSPHITKEEIDTIAKFSGDKGLLPENTRVRKSADGQVFEILIASAQTSVPPSGGDIGTQTEFKLDSGPLSGKTVKLVYGDYAAEMAVIAQNITKAVENSDNDTQQKMHKAYAASFDNGSLLSFKESQRQWIRDKGPMVECNIGFIETYRDPAGVRGEWEGFAAMVNLERTRAFGALVDAAPSLIPILPWSKDFEKDKFLSPDFTSLEVLTFCGSGIPAGINIPNYDDIRQTDGFKNVSLGNVMSAKTPNEKIPFIADEDLEVYKKYRDDSFEVQVGLHELTGHGCGKLLQETAPGKYNFDINQPPISPITNKPVTTWYKPGQTWSSVFGGLAGAYEECRAELVAMYLGCEFPVLKIFGFGDGSVDMDGEAGDVLYASYLSMARMGLISVEFWDPKSQKWGQPHCQARFAILKCFLEAGDDFCKLVHSKDDLSDLTIKLDRSKILSAGRKAVGDFLQKIHIYKSTADVETGSKFFQDMSSVGLDYWGTKVRDVVLENKQPRKVFVQANTYLDEATGKVTLKEYDPTPEGMIKSWADREA